MLHKLVVTQFIGNNIDSSLSRQVHIQKEFEVPFVPSKEVYVIFPDLNTPFVTYLTRIHFDMRDGKWYAEANAKWVEVFDGVEYDWSAAEGAIERYVEEMVESGWEVVRDISPT